MCRSLSWRMVRFFRLCYADSGTGQYRYAGTAGYGRCKADTGADTAGNQYAGTDSDRAGSKAHRCSHSRTYGNPWDIRGAYGEAGDYAGCYSREPCDAAAAGRRDYGGAYPFARGVTGTDVDTGAFADGSSGV